MAGIFVELFVISVSQETKHEHFSKNSGKIQSVFRGKTLVQNSATFRSAPTLTKVSCDFRSLFQECPDVFRFALIGSDLVLGTAPICSSLFYSDLFSGTPRFISICSGLFSEKVSPFFGSNLRTLALKTENFRKNRSFE